MMQPQIYSEEDTIILFSQSKSAATPNGPTGVLLSFEFHDDSKEVFYQYRDEIVYGLLHWLAGNSHDVFVRHARYDNSLPVSFEGLNPVKSIEFRFYVTSNQSSISFYLSERDMQTDSLSLRFTFSNIDVIFSYTRGLAPLLDNRQFLQFPYNSARVELVRAILEKHLEADASAEEGVVYLATTYPKGSGNPLFNRLLREGQTELILSFPTQSAFFSVRSSLSGEQRGEALPITYPSFPEKELEWETGQLILATQGFARNILDYVYELAENHSLSYVDLDSLLTPDGELVEFAVKEQIMKEEDLTKWKERMDLENKKKNTR